MNRIELRINDDKTQTVVTPQPLVEGENLTTEIAVTPPESWAGYDIRCLLTTPAGVLVDAVACPVELTNTMLDGKGTLYVEYVAMKDGAEIARTKSPALLPVSAARSILGDIDPAPLPDLVAEMVAAKGGCDDAAAAAVLATERIETTDAEIKAAEAVRETERLKWTNATAQATTLEPDAQATASVTDGETGKVFNIGVPRGADGDVTAAQLTALVPIKQNPDFLPVDIASNLVDFGWIDGKLYDTATGNITNYSGYSYSVKFPCAPGMLYCLENRNRHVMYWDRNNIYLGYTAAVGSPARSPWLFRPILNAAYMAFNATPANMKSAYLKRMEPTDTEKLREIASQYRIKTADKQVYLPKLIFDYAVGGRAEVYIDPATGSEYKTEYTKEYTGTPFIPVIGDKKYRTVDKNHVSFYDINGAFISGLQLTSFNSAYYYDFTAPVNCCYARLSSYLSTDRLYLIDPPETLVEVRNSEINELTYAPYAGKKAVFFGDSITGNFRFPYDFPSIVQANTGMSVYNCGFGGTGYTNHSNASYLPFSMNKLADAIVSANFGSQDAVVSTSLGSTYPGHLNLLKTIDFATVDYVFMLFGTNEIGTVLENAGDKFDVTKFNGAIRYSIRSLLTAFPGLKITLLTPIYRYYMPDAIDSDAYTSNGIAFTAYVRAVIDVAKEYHLPCIDLYYGLGFNSINRLLYFPSNDGTHPNSTGRELIGRKIARSMQN